MNARMPVMPRNCAQPRSLAVSQHLRLSETEHLTNYRISYCVSPGGAARLASRHFSGPGAPAPARRVPPRRETRERALGQEAQDREARRLRYALWP
eukprot:5640789-Pleurochrysis_carterae.AAC.1